MACALASWHLFLSGCGSASRQGGCAHQHQSRRRRHPLLLLLQLPLLHFLPPTDSKALHANAAGMLVCVPRELRLFYVYASRRGAKPLSK